MTKIMAGLRRIGRLARSAVDGNAVEREHAPARDDEIVRRLDLLTRRQTDLLKAVTIQLERARPSRVAWAYAWFCLIASAALVSLSAILTVNASSVNSQVSALHEQANANRTEALQDLLPFEEVGALVTPVQLRHELLADPKRLYTLLSQAKIGITLQNQADKIDAQADRYDAETTTGQIAAVTGLAVSSAFFGSILAWMLTALLAELRWRRRGHSESAETPSATGLH